MVRNMISHSINMILNIQYKLIFLWNIYLSIFRVKSCFNNQVVMWMTADFVDVAMNVWYLCMFWAQLKVNLGCPR